MADNTFFGTKSLSTTTTGSQNTAVGGSFGYCISVDDMENFEYKHTSDNKRMKHVLMKINKKGFRYMDFPLKYQSTIYLALDKGYLKANNIHIKDKHFRGYFGITDDGVVFVDMWDIYYDL